MNIRFTKSIQFRTTRSHAEQYPCPYCHAKPGETCRNSANGEPVVYQPAHLARLRARDPETKPQ